MPKLFLPQLVLLLTTVAKATCRFRHWDQLALRWRSFTANRKNSFRSDPFSVLNVTRYKKSLRSVGFCLVLCVWVCGCVKREMCRCECVSESTLTGAT
jgi:hypothetical protein